MANRCPSCGGTLRFDIKKQKLVCEYCESEFAADSIAQMGGAAESPAFDQAAGDGAAGGETIDGKIFTCPNCGGEVFATDLDAVEYCSYFGTFVTLESRLVPGLYATGEVLDVDGDCGGFNLQWAWSSGWTAGLTEHREDPA